MKTIIGLFLVIALSAGYGAAPPPGQAAVSSQDQRVLRHDAAAVVKLVAVRVSDKAGRPVSGLRKDDFILTDNGERKTITEFESHVLTEEGMAIVPAVPETQASEKAPGMGRKIFIFLDLQGSEPLDNSNAKTAALHFVSTQLRPGDEVGVIGFSPMRGFFIQEYLATDRTKIRKAIENAKELPPSTGEMVDLGDDAVAETRTGRAEAGPERAQIQEDAGGAAGSVKMASSEGRTGSSAWLQTNVFIPGTSIFQRGDFVPRMLDLAQTLKYIPGNKSIVLFSGRSVGSAGRLGREFAGAGVPVFAVNTKSWIARVKNLTEKEKKALAESPLREFADVSGGKYFSDIKDVDGLAREIQTLTGNFYVLGYYVKENWDGQFHRIKVEVNRPDLHVYAQDGYFNPKPFALMTSFEKELHLFDLLYADKPAAAEAPDLPLAPVHLALPQGRDGIILVQAAVDAKSGVSPAKVELFVLLRDANRTPVISRRWEMDFSPYEGKTLILYVRAPRRHGQYDGRLVARDLETGRAAVGRIDLRIAPFPEGEIVLSSPLIFAPGDESKCVLMPSSAPRKGTTAEPTLAVLYPFVPRNHRLVVRDLDSGTAQIMAVVPVEVRGARPEARPRIEVSGRLRPRPSGEEVPLDLEVVAVKTSADGREFLVLRIPLSGAKPGEYDLEIEAADADSGRKDAVRSALVLK